MQTSALKSRFLATLGMTLRVRVGLSCASRILEIVL